MLQTKIERRVIIDTFLTISKCEFFKLQPVGYQTNFEADMFEKKDMGVTLIEILEVTMVVQAERGQRDMAV